jgi:hypothetical protein
VLKRSARSGTTRSPEAQTYGEPRHGPPAPIIRVQAPTEAYYGDYDLSDLEAAMEAFARRDIDPHSAVLRRGADAGADLVRRKWPFCGDVRYQVRP